MCDFHLKGQCFHPEKATKGIVATSCSFHSCSDCTNKKWQQGMIEQKYEYYQSIVELTQNNIVKTEVNENNKPLLTRIFSAKN